MERVRGWLRRRGLSGERGWLALLLCLVALCWVLTAPLSVHPLPIASQAVPIVLAGVVLELRTLRPLLITIMVAVVAAMLELGYTDTRLGSVIVVAVVAVVVVRTAANRELLGVVGVRGDSVLADLRDRLASMAVLPPMPAGWHADAAAQLAGGLSFGGDLVVTHSADELLQVALVDVSGSGLAAATRALQLSGAFGGLVGAVPTEQFLTAANGYVLRQEWDDGFATAVHVTVDTRTGRYAVRSAGHPPVAVFRASDGSWQLDAAAGPALGLLPDPTYEASEGVLHAGDALLAFTDGMVELHDEEIEHGIARLLGAATTLVVDRFAGGAQRLLDATSGPRLDDRAVVLVWRS